MHKTCKLLPVFLALVCLGTSAQANKIVNGSFEAVDGRIGLVNGLALDNLSAGPGWDVYDSLPGGWYTGGGTSGIEVQHQSALGLVAADGLHYVELDSHWNAVNGNATNSTMSQDILGLSAGDYLFEFAYRPRTPRLDDNGIEVTLGGDVLTLADGVWNPATDWLLYSIPVEILFDGDYTLTFSAVGSQNTLGGFVDDVSLTSAPMPEPSAALVFATGLGVVGLHRRRRSG